MVDFRVHYSGKLTHVERYFTIFYVTPCQHNAQCNMLQMKYLSPFHWIIDKIHVDIDGVYVWNAVLDPDLCVTQPGPGECGHGELCLVTGVVLHQTPVLQHPVLLSNL